MRDRQQIEVTASFGVANIIDGQHPLSHALASAEIACKAAKDRGRNRVEVYFDGDQSIVRRYTDLTLIEHRALGAARPALPARGADDRPAERRAGHAQVRTAAAHERRDPATSVPPEKFLSAAERYQLAPAIDRWVLRRVIEMLQPNAAQLHAMQACFAVNISGPVAGRRGLRRLHRIGPARQRAAARTALVRGHRDRGGRQHRPRRVADPPAARAGLRRRARRLRPRPQFAHLPEDAAGDAPEDRRQLRPRRGRRRPLAGDAQRDRAAGARDEAAHRRRMRRKRRDPARHRASWASNTARDSRSAARCRSRSVLETLVGANMRPELSRRPPDSTRDPPYAPAVGRHGRRRRRLRPCPGPGLAARGPGRCRPVRGAVGRSPGPPIIGCSTRS